MEFALPAVPLSPKEETLFRRTVHTGGAFDLDKLKRMRDDCDKAGAGPSRVFAWTPATFVMKPGPERERKLDQTIDNSARPRWWVSGSSANTGR